MKEKDIEQKLQRMAELEAAIKPAVAKIKADQEEYKALEEDIKKYALKEDFRGDRAFEHGIVKVNSGRPALTLLDGKNGSASWDEVVTKLRGLRLKRFIRIKEEAMKNRIKDEMKPEIMKQIGVHIITEPSVSVEVF